MHQEESKDLIGGNISNKKTEVKNPGKLKSQQAQVRNLGFR